MWRERVFRFGEKREKREPATARARRQRIQSRRARALARVGAAAMVGARGDGSDRWWWWWWGDENDDDGEKVTNVFV